MSVSDEGARLYALRQLNLLDTPPSESFDRITRMACQIFGLPIGAVSLTDTDRQWFKSRVGISHDTIARHKAPCAEVTETKAMLVIPDLASDPCYSDSALADAGIRFYAGAPLVTHDGHGLGALCVLGTEPRSPAPEETAALTDLAAMVMAQIELRHAFGRVDPVSGLPNRFQFVEDFEDLTRDCPGQQRFMVMVDLARADELGTLTRVMGASYIETFVKDAAQTVRTLVDADRVVYHIAATQFAFLSRADVSLSAYIKVVAAGLETSRTTSLARYVTTTAAGIVPVTLGTMRSQELLRAGHGAAQDAQTAPGFISVFTRASERETEQSRNITLLLAYGAALETCGQMRLVYQPRIDLARRRCVGVEALLRWRHPRLGEVSPGEFIPVIERTALAKPTTAFVLETALRQHLDWREQGLVLPLSINIATSNLEDDDFVEQITAALARHAIPPAMLELEVTETAVMENSVLALARLEALAATGIRIAIDDFGTGHSSLAYLQTLPADVVKIDKSFVDALGADDGRGETIIATMITLISELGLRVVAEGVETADAVAMLTNMGCDEVQGYAFAPALEAGALLPWIAQFNGTAGAATIERAAA